MATLKTGDIKPMAKGDIEAKERIWLNADRTQVVPEGDEDAYFLLSGEGGMIAKEDAEKFGIGEDGKTSGKSKAKKAGADESDAVANRSKRVVAPDSKK